MSFHHGMLRCHIAFRLPRYPVRWLLADRLTPPKMVMQGFDPPDARLVIVSVLEELAAEC